MPVVTNEKLFEIGARIWQRATTDADFRALALRDGTRAVEQVLGAPLPDGVKIRFVDNDGAWLTLGLPPARSTDELSDQELEVVAGGNGGGGVGVPDPNQPLPSGTGGSR